MIFEFLDGTNLFVMGSLQRGRLGSPNSYSPNVEEEEDPKLHQLSQATRVNLPAEVGTLRGMANGFEHSLLLTSW